MKHSWTMVFITLTFLSLAPVASGDTLVLRNGTLISGSLVKANPHAIEFQDDLGWLYIIDKSQIQTLQITSGGKDTTEPPSLQKETSDANEARESELIHQLLRRVAQLEATVGELQKSAARAQVSSPLVSASSPRPAEIGFKEAALHTDTQPSVTLGASPVPEIVQSTQEQSPESHEHTMAIPGFGPELKLRGFLDFNFGLGDVANPLISPLGAPGHATFQEGEFDLFITSKLSRTHLINRAR